MSVKTKMIYVGNYDQWNMWGLYVNSVMIFRSTYEEYTNYGIDWNGEESSR